MNQWYLYSAPIIHVVSLAAVFDLSRNAPPHQGALRDETKTAARGDYYYMPFVYHCFPSLFEFLRPRLSSKRALRQQRRRRVRKRNLKSKFALLQTLSHLFHFVQVVGKCWQILCSWILKDCIKIQEKKKNVVVLSSRLPTNMKVGIFTPVVVVQWRQRNVQKNVMHVQNCWFANQTYRVFTVFDRYFY